MENQNGFDLNAALATWRAALAGQESIDPDRIRELESHLREAIAVWVSKDLTEEEAFELETRRLGRPTQLAHEFQTEDTQAAWRNRVYWAVISLMTMLLLIEVSKALFASASYLFAWLWLTDEQVFISLSVPDVFRPEFDGELKEFLPTPAQLPLWAALLTPLALYLAAGFRARAASNPRSDFYRLTRTRIRAVFTLAGLITFSHVTEIAAHFAAQQALQLSPLDAALLARTNALELSCAWALAILAIASSRRSSRPPLPQRSRSIEAAS